MIGLSRWRGLPVLAATVVAVLTAVAVFSQVTIRSDMADFLPHGKTEAARLMLRELRSGSATSLIMIGIEGAPPDELARISQSMRRDLDRSGLFFFVNNGAQELLGSDAQQILFSHRYLLSPATTADAFSVAALHVDMENLLRGLQSSAAPVVAQFGLADPPNAFLAILREWAGSSRVRTLHGVWFAPERDRALILTRSKATSLDLEGQEAVNTAIQRAFSAAVPGSARLLLAGPAVSARAAAEAMRADITTLSVASTILLCALLLWRFRSFWILLVVAIPVTVGIAAAALAVQLVYGFVHGITIGFGMTMLGVTLDYPVLLVGHRKHGEAAAATLRRIGQAFKLTVISAALGLTGMLFSSFPGLSQLGCFSIVGVAVAAAVTRFVLPQVIVAAGLAPVSAGDPAALLRVERLRVWRGWVAGGVLAVGGGLLSAGGPRWQNNMAALSPVPPAVFALDAELRGEIGAPDAVLVGLVRGASQDAVLQQEERLLPELDPLKAEGVLSGAEIAAQFVPSVATQLERRARLPAPDVLSSRVAAAQAGLPFRANAFQGFIGDVAASRTMSPLLPSDFASPLIRARLDPLLFQRDGAWYGLIAPAGLTDPGQFAAVLHQAGASTINITGEVNAIVAASTTRAWRWLALGGSAALVTLAVGLRSVRRVIAVVTAVLAALLLTVAILTALDTDLSLIHIVSLQFVAGVGLDYALFFARRQLDQEERARTLRTLGVCNAMTVLTFGLLALCQTPLLRQIGVTVVIGAIAALVFAFLFAGEMPSKVPEPG